MKKLIFLIFLILVLVLIANYSFAENYSPQTTEFDIDGLNTLKINNLAGNINITSINESVETKSVVVANKIKFDKTCKLFINRNSNEILIELTRAAFKDSCQVNFDIKLPKKAFLDLTNGAGHIKINDVNGSAKINNGSGNFFNPRL